MPKRSFSFASVCLGLAAILWGASASSGEAAVLDWDSVNWTPTWNSAGDDPSQTFNNVNNSGINIRITVSRPAHTTSSEVLSPGSLPNDIDTQFTGRGQALVVDVDWNPNTSGQGSLKDYIQFDIEFFKYVPGGSATQQTATPAAMSWVTFELWDIDLGNASSGGTTSSYQDIIKEFKTYRNGAQMGVMPTFSDLGNGSDYEVFNGELHGIAAEGSKTALGNGNDDTRSGDVLFSYNGTKNPANQAIDKISFQYQPGDGSTAGVDLLDNSTLQRIALGDINFTAVPEVFSAQGALFACAAVIVSPWFGRRRRRVEAAA